MNRRMIIPGTTQSDKFDCGPACLYGAFAYYGTEIDYEFIKKTAGTNERDGTSVQGMIDAIRHYHFKYRFRRDMSINNLRGEMESYRPVIIPMQAYIETPREWKDCWDDGHYVIPVYYDFEKIYFFDPSEGLDTELGWGEFERRWHDMDKNGIYNHCGIVVLGERKLGGIRSGVSNSIHMD